MREIKVSIDVFAEIWALRQPSEHTESEVLARILRENQRFRTLTERQVKLVSNIEDQPSLTPKEVNTSFLSLKEEPKMISPEIGKLRWVDDVSGALKSLGGEATLQAIYREVETRRKRGGRSVPQSLEATIRRTIEDHSEDSDNFRGLHLFKKIRRGEWALAVE
jgi:hypothetical protein